MDNVRSPPRHRHTRSAIVDTQNITRPDSYPVYNLPPWSAELAADTPGASGSRASRILTTMRRSFSTPRKRDSSPMDIGMYSTPEESTPPAPPRYDMQHSLRPTVQQIAMGLHISPTPHLHPSHSHPPHSLGSSPSKRLGVDTQRRRGSASAVMLPPPPKRSSLKKPGTPTSSSAPLTPSASDVSLTGSTLTSHVIPPAPRTGRSASVNLIPARLQFSVSKLLRVPSARKTFMASPTMSTDSDGSSSSVPLTPRKMVRFSSSPNVERTQHEAEAVSPWRARS